MKKPYLHDPKCADLAEHFLVDTRFASADDRLMAERELAVAVQKFIEDWMNYRTSDPQALRSNWSGADVIPDDIAPFM